MATLKQNQIDLDLSRVEDLATREALESVVRFVNELASSGVKTGGPVTGKSFATNAKTGGLTEAGWLSGKSLELDAGGRFKVEYHEGTVNASGTGSYTVKGTILGAFGIAQFEGGSDWRVMGRGSVTNSVYFTNGSSTTSLIHFTNSDASHQNGYRLVIFYRES